MNTNWLLKTVLLAQHTAMAVLAGELHQKALLQRFLIATTAGKVFQQPANIRANPRYPREKTLPADALATKEPKELREDFFMIHVLLCG